MASITIRNLDAGIKERLRVLAARQGRSMEEAAREILRAAVTDRRPSPPNLVETVRRRFAYVGGVDLPVEPREPAREPPRLKR